MTKIRIVDKLVFVGIIFIFLLTGCGNSSTNGENKLQGYILEVQESKLLFANNMTKDEFQQSRGLSVKEMEELENVPDLIYIQYGNGDNLEVGDRVNVWLDGGIETSFPGRGAAKEVEKIK